MHTLSIGEVSCFRAHAVAKRALEDIDDLFIVRMAVRRWDSGGRGYSELKHAHARIARPIDQVTDTELADVNFNWTHIVLLHDGNGDGDARVPMNRQPSMDRCGLLSYRTRNCVPQPYYSSAFVRALLESWTPIYPSPVAAERFCC